MEYDIIEVCGMTSLISIVNKRLKQGWVCQGGVAVIPESEEVGLSFCQAMVRTKIVEVNKNEQN